MADHEMSISSSSADNEGSDDAESSFRMFPLELLISSSRLKPQYEATDTSLRDAQKPSSHLAASNIAILVPPATEKWEYQVYRSGSEVQHVVTEFDNGGELQYLVRFSNGSRSEVSDPWFSDIR